MDSRQSLIRPPSLLYKRGSLTQTASLNITDNDLEIDKELARFKLRHML